MSNHEDKADPRQEWPIRTSLLAGSVAAIAATVVSLPLHSPTDTLLNSATVTLGALAAALATGVIWKGLSRYAARPRIFAVVWALGLGLVAAAAVAGEAQLERSASFAVPLAIIAFAITGISTATLSRSSFTNRWWLAALALLVAVGVGIGLMGQGDQKSGRLTLPPRTELSAESGTWAGGTREFTMVVEREVG